jgi:hypothetical protein
VRLYRGELAPYALLAGGAATSFLTFWICVFHVAYRSTFLAFALASTVLALTISRRNPHIRRRPPGRFEGWRRIAFIAVITVFTVTYLFVALAPEVSADGGTYHLGFVARYAREHGFVPIYTNFYSGLPQGAELLYLVAFLFGGHSAAALVHFGFWLVLPWLILSFFRRIGKTNAGLLAGILMFTPPVTADVGSTAYVDAFLVTVCFGAFACAEMWRLQGNPRMLALACVLAGFAVSIKYTGYPAILYVLLTVLLAEWRQPLRALRTVLLAGLVSSAIFLPWIARNWIYYGNPLCPFANRVFPNPYVLASFEEGYRKGMATFGGVHWSADLPLEFIIRGNKLQGMLGPAFLLLPVALLAVWRPLGRRLLLAGMVFLLPYPANLGTRFVLPSIVFLGSAMAMCISEFGFAAVVLAGYAVITTWPGNVRWYAAQYAAYRSDIPVAAALHPSFREAYLIQQKGSDYLAARLIDQYVPPGARVLSLRNIADAYTHAEIMVSFQGALNSRLYQELSAPLTMPGQHFRRATFAVPGRWGKFRILAPLASASNMEVYEVSANADAKQIGLHRLTASSARWDARLTIDHNLVTAWRSDGAAPAGTYLQFESQVYPQVIGIVVSDEQPLDTWQLQASTNGSTWQTISKAAQIEHLEISSNLEHAAAQDLLENGVRYLLVDQAEPVDRSLSANADLWPVILMGTTQSLRLYKLR